MTARTNRWSCASLEGATSATLFIVHALERSAAATRRRWPRGLGLACEAKGCWVETARAACFLYRHRRYAGSTPTGLVCDWVDNCQRRSDGLGLPRAAWELAAGTWVVDGVVGVVVVSVSEFLWIKGWSPGCLRLLLDF